KTEIGIHHKDAVFSGKQWIVRAVCIKLGIIEIHIIRCNTCTERKLILPCPFVTDRNKIGGSQSDTTCADWAILVSENRKTGTHPVENIGMQSYRLHIR